MSKKKNHTALWTVINIICWPVAVVMGWNIAHQIQEGPRIIHVPQQIALEHNKYGDYLVGLMAKENHDYDTMITAFESALKQDPDDPKLKKSVYLLKAIRGDINDIIPLAKDLNTLRQAELLTDYVLIAEAIQKNSYVEAQTLLSQKPAYGADQILKPALSAWIAVGLNDRGKAEKALNALNTSKSQALYHYYMALVALAFQDEESAEKSFKKMSLHSDKGYPSLTAVVFLRDFFQRRQKWTAGFPEYDRYQVLLNASPSVKEVADDLKVPPVLTPQIGSAISFYDVSVALAPLKLEETSLLLNALAIYLQPDETAFRIWTGELLDMSGNYQAANRVYQKIEHKNDVILMKMAINFVTLGQYQDSLEPLQKLIQKNPNDGYIQMVIGDSFFQTKNYDKAVQAYTKSSSLLQKENKTASAGHALLMLGMTYDQMGHTQKAEETLLTALRLTPNDADTLNYLGYLWLDGGKNIDEAFNMVHKAADLKPNDPNIMDSLALGYYLKKEYQKALELAEKSTDQLSYSSVAYAHLGDIYAALGRPQEARYQYRKALDLTADITPKLKAELEKKLNLSR